MSTFNPEKQKLLEEGHEGLLPSVADISNFEESVGEILPIPEGTEVSEELGENAVESAGVEPPVDTFEGN